MHTRGVYPPSALLEYPDALLKKAHILALLSIGESTLSDRIKAGTFPHPDIRTGRLPMWRVGTWKAWQAGEMTRALQAQHDDLQRRMAQTTSPTERRDLMRDATHVKARLESVRRALAG